MRGTIPSLVAMIACLASSGALAAHLPNGVGMSGCDAIVAQVQVDSATAKIEEATEVALSDEFGYSRLGGGGAGRIHESTPDGPLGRGGGSFSNLTCLERLMDSTMDVLFEPPGMPDLLGAMEDFICDQAENIYESVRAPINEAIADTADLGGFYPGVNLGRMGGGIQPGPSGTPGHGGLSEHVTWDFRVQDDDMGLNDIFGAVKGTK